MPVNDMPNAYWAGLFDGEGNIQISKDLKHVQVGLTQKEPQILMLAKQRFGGNITSYQTKYRYHPEIQLKQCTRWRVVQRDEMIAFLEAVEPYCFIKATEVKIALQFLRGMKAMGTRHQGHIGAQHFPKMSPEETARRQELYDLFQTDRRDPKLILN